MEINFSNQDALFVYGVFLKKVQELEKIKNSRGCPFSKSDMDKEIKLHTSVMEKLREAIPELQKMDSYNLTQ